MGQYRQWLHYRHVDRQLQEQKEQLTEALQRLRVSIHDLDTNSPIADNHIIQALMLYEKASSITVERHGEDFSNKQGATPEITSQTLFEHNRLADFDALYTKDSNEGVSSKELPSTHTSAPVTGEALHASSENATTQHDEQAPTDPQIALPWWLQRATLADTQSSGLDAQSMRTNQRVQRWLERWGRQTEQGQHWDTDSTPSQQERGLS